MTTRDFESLVYKISPSVPGCPQPTIIQYIRDAAIRTCERTLAWRYQIPTYKLSTAVPEYPYIKPKQTNVHAIFAAVVNCRTLKPATIEQAICRYPCWADAFNNMSLSEIWKNPGTYNANTFNGIAYNGSGAIEYSEEALKGASEPQIICQLDPDGFIILPMPDDKEYTLRMFVALKPSRDAIGMDKVLFDELEDVIVHCALQHLLVLPGTNWSDRELAAYHAKQYLFHVTESRARANLGNARASINVQMTPFGA